MNELMKKLKSASNLKHTTTLDKSSLFTQRDNIAVDVPIINLAFSGHFNKGFGSGLIMFAGPSKHFKSNLGLLTVKAYLKSYQDAVCIYYDSEFGCTPEYIQAAGIDPERVLHVPIMNIEELKFDVIQQLQQIKKGDKVIIFIDSVGNLASKKEVEDAINEKSVADMTRAKQLKSLWRMVTPYLTIHDIPCIVINHTYQDISLFPKDIVSGGCLVKGTKIKMADGSFKEIQNVLIDDLVKTKDGDKNVTAIWNPDTLINGTPECYEIEFEDGYKVICSENHKFLINDEWVCAALLSENDMVSINGL